MTSMLLVRYPPFPFPLQLSFGRGEMQHLENWTDQAEASQKEKSVCVKSMCDFHQYTSVKLASLPPHWKRILDYRFMW